MAEAETFIFRASLKPKIYRDFEISSTSSLDTLAQAIVRFFDFDHAFGFYSGLKENIYRSPVRYELFVDLGEGEGEARSVKRTRAGEAFRRSAPTCVFFSTMASNGCFWSSSSTASRKSRRSGSPGC
jgi:hypothetical protein